MLNGEIIKPVIRGRLRNQQDKDVGPAELKKPHFFCASGAEKAEKPFVHNGERRAFSKK